MAKLLKERARKPLLEGAAAIGSPTFEDGALHYRIDLFRSSDPRHSLILTRAEMLGLVSEWMKTEARRATESKKQD